MTESLPYIFGIPALIVGLYLFLLYSGTYKPKYKSNEQKERFEKVSKKFGTLIIICSIIMIINGSYDLIVRDANRYRIKPAVKNDEWSTEKREILVAECVKKSGNTGKSYPEAIKMYCECAYDKISNSMTYSEYKKFNKTTNEEQIKLIEPLIKECLDQLKTRIDSLEKQNTSH